MKETTLNLYEYSELSPEAKEKALQHYKSEYFDHSYLHIQLDQYIEPLLEKNGITPVSTADKRYQSKYATLYFSLSHSQGDGVMFEGTFTWKKWTVNIQQRGMYYHSHAKVIELTNDNGDIPSEKDMATFEAIYQSICKELEREGYSVTEDLESEAFFIEECNANEWTFEKDGTMRNI